MINRNILGVSPLILSTLFLAFILVTVAIGIQMTKTKSIESSMATEYDLRTYYVALAGVNECIATRMLPRSNTVFNNNKLSNTELKRLGRIDNSGVISSNPYSINSNDVIGKYSYVSNVVTYDDKGNVFIDEFNDGTKEEKYLVYSKGITKLPNGKEDSLIIKAVFDLNRLDNDVHNVDEIESFEVLPVNAPEAAYAEALIINSSSDKTPPMPREVMFSSLGGSEVVAGIHGEGDYYEINNVGVRTKISVKFNEPIDSKFLNGISIIDVESDTPIKDIEKVAISPKNIEVVILPPKKAGGQMFDYGSKYKLEVTDIVDYNGNILNDGPEIEFITEQPSYTGLNDDSESLLPSQYSASTTGENSGEGQNTESPPDKVNNNSSGIQFPKGTAFRSTNTGNPGPFSSQSGASKAFAPAGSINQQSSNVNNQNKEVNRDSSGYVTNQGPVPSSRNSTGFASY